MLVGTTVKSGGFVNNFYRMIHNKPAFPLTNSTSLETQRASSPENVYIHT